jgi:bleomycin hydrolase
MNCLTPGSQFHNIQWVMKNYGLVPEEAYTGKPGGEKNHNHAELDTALTKYITGMVQQKKNAPDITDWINLNAILTANLGKLPFTFVINGKTFTPKTYLQSLPIQPDDYIEITSYNHHPYYQPFVFENKYNYSYDKYMNVPLADFMAITDNALKNGYTVLWNGDVTDKGFNFYEGNAALHNIKDAVAERQRTFADSTSYMDHMMHVAGIYAGSDGHKWYYIKNSWGTGNNLNGYLLMDENYFKIKTAAIVVNKEAIPAAIRQRMKW